MIHEDERRILEDWPEAKTITAKEDCVLGNHYHKLKTEKFILIQGEGEIKLDTGFGSIKRKMKIGRLYTVMPFQQHTFTLTKGSVLIGLCSEKFDPSDDYKL